MTIGREVHISHLRLCDRFWYPIIGEYLPVIQYKEEGTHDPPSKPDNNDTDDD